MAEYIDNKKFLQALKDYDLLCKEAESRGEEQPRVPEYIGECFILLCEKIATRWNFSNYSYKEDMILAGIEICLRRVRSFDPTQWDNPFGYFSRIIWRTLGDIIKDEHKQSYIKAKMTIDDFIMADALSDIEEDFGTNSEESATASPYFDWMSYEQKREAERAEKRKPKGLVVIPENALF